MTDFTDFLDYYDKVRARTLKVVHCIPPAQIEWTIKEGAFTLGDIVRHLAAIERHMYAENAQFKPSKYNGCGQELARGFDDVLKFLNDTHDESMTIFRGLSAEDVNRKCETPGGAKITLWKWLRLMAEHEIHHRGQLYIYLNVLGIKTAPLYGLTSEEVAMRSRD